MTTRIRLEDALRTLPSDWPQDPLPLIRDMLAATGEKLAVVDDDPMGTQTVSQVPVLLNWSPETIQSELDSQYPGFFMVTNSRGMLPPDASRANFEVGRSLSDAGRKSQQRFTVMNRGDSTLRGHFPAEFQALEDGLGGGFDAWILMPFFLEGGRYTIADTHYVSDGEWLTPVGETEFASDPAFAFQSSNMKAWIEEVTAGDVGADDVRSISISDIRNGGPVLVAELLMGLADRSVCIVNAASMRDAEVVALATLIAEHNGKGFLYRTAASLIRARLGQPAPSLLKARELVSGGSGGVLVLVGSCVPRSTTQLEYLLSRTNINGIELAVDMLLSDTAFEEIRRVAGQVSRAIADGRDTVVYTSRQQVKGGNLAQNLQIGQRISDGLASMVRSIDARPRAIISKGGMTTYNVASRALGVRRTVGLGQILPGVPVWQLGPDARFPDTPLVLFPGNVGSESALADVLAGLGPNDTLAAGM